MTFLHWKHEQTEKDIWLAVNALNSALCIKEAISGRISAVHLWTCRSYS